MVSTELLNESLAFKVGWGSLPKTLSTISSYHSPVLDSIVPIKSLAFAKELGRLKSDTKSQFAIMLEQSLLDKHPEIEKMSDWGLIVDSVDLALCLYSKVFYDFKFAKINHFVDGRQMGNAHVSPYADIAQSAFIGEGVTVEENCVIHPHVTIMAHAHIGAGTIVFPNTTIYPFVRIANRCRIHAQCTIGADGFGYNFIDGEHKKLWHLGGVEIGNDVEIGSGTSVDYGCFSATVIGDGCRIDNQVQISHNAILGKGCVMCGKSGVAGSCELGDYVIFAATAGAAPGARIGSGSQVAARAVVSEKAIIPPKSILAGQPARPMREWLRAQAIINKIMKDKLK